MKITIKKLLKSIITIIIVNKKWFKKIIIFVKHYTL